MSSLQIADQTARLEANRNKLNTSTAQINKIEVRSLSFLRKVRRLTQPRQALWLPRQIGRAHV